MDISNVVKTFLKSHLKLKFKLVFFQISSVRWMNSTCADEYLAYNVFSKSNKLMIFETCPSKTIISVHS